MTTPSVDNVHRTVKLELDSGRAASFAEAEALAKGHVLQIAVGDDVADSQTRQAMLLTAVNTGVRAFVGGVRVTGPLDWALTTPWHRGEAAESVVTFYGASVESNLEQDLPTVVIGDVVEPVGSVVLYLTWDGWVGAAVDVPSGRLPEDVEFPLAGVLAAGFAVAEAFQHIRGAVVAGRRSVGLSLWRPDLDWRDEAARGDRLWFLPTRLWVLGLGHLGQANLWALGFLPYRCRDDVELTLQDFD